MKTYDVTPEEFERIQKEPKKHLIVKNIESGELFIQNPLEVNWSNDYPYYYWYDQELNKWKDIEKPRHSGE